MSKKKVVMGLVLVIAVGAGFYLHRQKLQKQQASSALQNEIIRVERRDLSEIVSGDGKVVFSKNGGIYPAYKATVQKILCQAGAKVKKGDLLMVLTSDALKSSWVDAEHKYQTAKLNLARAEKELERQKILYEVQGTTIDELETAQNNVELYRVALSEARSNLELLTETTDEANFVGDDHRTIMIRAPFDGEVAWVEVKVGQTVSAIGSSSSDSSSNNLLLYLVAEGSLEVEATVDETEIDRVKAGQKAKVTLNDLNQTELYGTVTEVGSYGSEDAGVIVFPVKIRLDRVRDVIIRPQMTADVAIYITSKPNALAIPSGAVLKLGGKTMVKKVTGPKIELVEVELGAANASYVEVLSGLEEGDPIIANPKAAPAAKKSVNGQPERGRNIRLRLPSRM
ncbi:MAG: efflux RND transporter periplasmic adaptor subunit [Firmicutes bacterium]|nr:efflux RND transporter periplasmic adaptor subunit [Bacillota bacterium]